MCRISVMEKEKRIWYTFPRELTDISWNGCGRNKGMNNLKRIGSCAERRWSLNAQSHESSMPHCFRQQKAWILSLTILLLFKQTLQYPELAWLLIGALWVPDAVLSYVFLCVRLCFPACGSSGSCVQRWMSLSSCSACLSWVQKRQVRLAYYNNF